jgi:AcrR family transcriptional regulator
MGVKERRDRDHEQMRLLILEAARVLFLKEGYESTSIRRIAVRIEYSPAAIYRYFTSKEDIFFAIAETGFRLFGKAIRNVRASADPVETLRRRFWRYYEFSKSQPEYFALMFVDRSVPRLTREWERMAFMRATREELSALVAACVTSGAFPADTDPAAVFHILAAAVHGAAVIRLSDRFIPRRNADALARDVLETTLAGLRHGVPLTFRAEAGFHRGGNEAPRLAAGKSARSGQAGKTLSSEDLQHVR